jgi:hypothetical protein
LLNEIQSEREPHNPLACFAMADLLEEEGSADLSFCYRYMGWRGRRPGFRAGLLLRKRFVWYEEKTFDAWPGEEAERYNALPMAWLHPLVFQALGPGNVQYRLYATWEQAVADLARALARLRELLGPLPETRKEP